MTRSKAKEAPVGQVDVFGTIHGLDKLVQKPDIIESEGLRVIHFAISEEDRVVPGYLVEVKKQARALLPEVRSNQRPPWLQQGWQVRKRKKKAGAI